MALSFVSLGFEYFPDFTQGRPVFNGQIFVGKPDTDPEVVGNQKQVILREEDGTEVPVSQPVLTGAGGVPTRNGSPVQMLVDGNYSLKVLNAQGSQVYNLENAFNGEPLTTSSDAIVILFDTVADMISGTLPDGSSISLSSGQIAQTNGYTTIGDTGAARYLIQTAAEFGGTPDEKGDHTLANTNVAVLQHNGIVHPTMYGAVGDGVANDLASLQAMVTASQSSKFKISSSPDNNFNLGTFPDVGAAPLFVITADGFTWDTGNCTFTVGASLDAAYAASSVQSIFKLEDVSNVTLGDYILIANQIQRTPTRIGVTNIWINSTAKNHGNISIGAITTTKCLANIICTSGTPASFRASGITCKYSKNTGGYYNINFADNGDNFSAVINSDDVIRSYFVYGISNHKALINSINHGTFSDVLISRVLRDTRNIDLVVNSVADSSTDQTINFNHVTDDTDAIVSDVNIKFSVTKSSAANPTIGFQSFTAASSPLATTTNRFDNIRLEGTTNSSTPILLSTDMTGETISRIYATAELMRLLSDTQKYMFKTSGSKRVAASNASGGMALKFHAPDLKLVPSWGRLWISGADNASASAAEYYQAAYDVAFTVASDGSTIITATQIVGTAFTAGALGPTVTFPAQAAGSYTFVVNLNNYTNANREVRGELEIFSFFE